MVKLAEQNYTVANTSLYEKRNISALISEAMGSQTENKNVTKGSIVATGDDAFMCSDRDESMYRLDPNAGGRRIANISVN